MNVWKHNGIDEEFMNLFNIHIDNKSIENSIILIILDMSSPWKFETILQKTFELLKNLFNKIPIDERKNNEDHLTKFLNDHMDHQSLESKKQNPENKILEFNFGLPVIIAVTKSDSIDQLRLDFGYKDDHFDFIQTFLRKICLKCTKKYFKNLNNWNFFRWSFIDLHFC